ncbi:unnamed protein product, partial [Mesorhabditis belari]|uniref:MH1 domain-containing protein n=1 Tax=Mesorhabditis belari TaxID=2138241 RepID=A0AAF3FNK9_9BILA
MLQDDEARHLDDSFFFYSIDQLQPPLPSPPIRSQKQEEEALEPFGDSFEHPPYLEPEIPFVLPGYNFPPTQPLFFHGEAFHDSSIEIPALSWLSDQSDEPRRKRIKSDVLEEPRNNLQILQASHLINLSGSIQCPTATSRDSIEHIINVLMMYTNTSEEIIFIRKFLKAVIKKLKVENEAQIDNLLQAILSNGCMEAGCVNISTALDGRMQVLSKKVYPEVFSVRIWRWPSLKTRRHIEVLRCCAKSEKICINPFHYEVSKFAAYKAGLLVRNSLEAQSSFIWEDPQWNIDTLHYVSPPEPEPNIQCTRTIEKALTLTPRISTIDRLASQPTSCFDHYMRAINPLTRIPGKIDHTPRLVNAPYQPLSRSEFWQKSRKGDVTNGVSNVRSNEISNEDRGLIEKTLQEIICLESGKDSISDDEGIHRFFAGYCFLCFLLLALIGNVLNLMISNSELIRSYFAIRMLSAKLCLNSFCMLTLVPSSLRLLKFWDYGTDNDLLYWKFWPYEQFFVAFLSLCCVWTTVLMTFVCYKQIFHPNDDLGVESSRNVFLSFFSMFILSILLSIHKLFVKVDISIDSCKKAIVLLAKKPEVLADFCVFLSMIANFLLGAAVPLLLLVYMTTSIASKLLRHDPLSGHFSAEKLCVTRITMLTTGLQFFSTISQMIETISLRNSEEKINSFPQFCLFHSITHFLFLSNLSLPFYVFFGISPRFRSIVMAKLRSYCPANPPQQSNAHSELTRMISPVTSMDDFTRPSSSSFPRGTPLYQL